MSEIDVLILSGPLAGRGGRMRLPVTIGSAPDCTISIPDPTIAPVHAYVAEGGPTYATLHTEHVVWVDGIAVSEIALCSGTLVDVGETTLRIAGTGDFFLRSPTHRPRFDAPPFRPKSALRLVARLAVPRDRASVTAVGPRTLLVVGGAEPKPDRSETFDHAELVDVDTGRSTQVWLGERRQHPIVVRLADASVLILGGLVPSWEILRPGAARADGGGFLLARRAGGYAHLLPDGRVLVVGGLLDAGRPSVELLEPWTGRSTPVDSPPLPHVDGVRVAGGALLLAVDRTTNPYTARFVMFREQPFGFVPIPGPARIGAELVALPDGRALVVGGYRSTRVDAFEPRTARFREVGSLLHPRFQFGAIALASGRVVVAGGSSSEAALTAEHWDPTTERFASLPALRRGLGLNGVARLDDGSAAFVGIDAVLVATEATVRDPVVVPAAAELSVGTERADLARHGLDLADWRALIKRIEALAAQGSSRETIVPALASLLEHGQPSVRKASARALGAWAGDARAAIPRFVARLRGETEILVQAELAHALAALDPSADGVPYRILGSMVSHLAARAADPYLAAAQADFAWAEPAPDVAEPARYAATVDAPVVAFSTLAPSPRAVPMLAVLVRSRNFKIRYAAEDSLAKVARAFPTEGAAIARALEAIAVLYDRADTARNKRLANTLALVPEGAPVLAKMLESLTEPHAFEGVLGVAMGAADPSGVLADTVVRLAGAAQGSRATALGVVAAKLRYPSLSPTLASRLRRWTAMTSRIASTDVLLEGRDLWVPILRAERTPRDRHDLPAERAGLAHVVFDGDAMVVAGDQFVPRSFPDATIVSTDAERAVEIVARTAEGIVIAVTQPFDSGTWGREHFLYEWVPSTSSFRRWVPTPSGWSVEALDEGIESSARRVAVGELRVWQESPFSEVRISADTTPTFLDDVFAPPEAVEAARREAAHRGRLLRRVAGPLPRLPDTWELAGLHPLVDASAGIVAREPRASAGAQVKLLGSLKIEKVWVALCRVGAGIDGIATIA